MVEPSFDPRVTPARPDLAAASLKGKIVADAYVDGETKAVVRGVADLRRARSPDATIETQLFFGEGFVVYEEAGGWSWGQSTLDDYVGYVETAALGSAPAATHRVTALQSHVYPSANIKQPPMMRLPMNALVAIDGREERFAHLTSGGYVPQIHIAPLARRAGDFVAIAERFLGCPYLWGGRTADGIDCSGLLQAALAATGLAIPRDADMQECEVGRNLSDPERATLRRGDLIFWPDHVAIMLDDAIALHANGYHMAVAREALSDVVARNRANGADIVSIRRLANK